MNYLHYTLLLLIPDNRAVKGSKKGTFTLHFATINTHLLPD